MNILNRQLVYKLWLKPDEAAAKLREMVLTDKAAFGENLSRIAAHLGKQSKPEIESKWYFSSTLPTGGQPEEIRWYHGEIREKEFWMHRLFSFSYFFKPSKVRVQRHLKGRMQSFKGKILPANHGSLLEVRIRPAKWARSYFNLLCILLLIGTGRAIYNAYQAGFKMDLVYTLVFFLVIFLLNYYFISWQVRMETDTVDKDIRRVFSNDLLKPGTTTRKN